MSRADLGGFEVAAAPAAVSAFRAATGLGDGDGVPLTFPMRWLAAPEVHAALASLVPEQDVVLVHESQSFDYAAPLRVGEAYRMTLTGRREQDPDRLVLDGTITAPDGTVRATFETMLRLFSTVGLAA